MEEIVAVFEPQVSLKVPQVAVDTNGWGSSTAPQDHLKNVSAVSGDGNGWGHPITNQVTNESYNRNGSNSGTWNERHRSRSRETNHGSRSNDIPIVKTIYNNRNSRDLSYTSIINQENGMAEKSSVAKHVERQDVLKKQYSRPKYPSVVEEDNEFINIHNNNNYMESDYDSNMASKKRKIYNNNNNEDEDDEYAKKTLNVKRHLSANPTENTSKVDLKSHSAQTDPKTTQPIIAQQPAQAPCQCADNLKRIEDQVESLKQLMTLSAFHLNILQGVSSQLAQSSMAYQQFLQYMPSFSRPAIAAPMHHHNPFGGIGMSTPIPTQQSTQFDATNMGNLFASSGGVAQSVSSVNFAKGEAASSSDVANSVNSSSNNVNDLNSN